MSAPKSSEFTQLWNLRLIAKCCPICLCPIHGVWHKVHVALCVRSDLTFHLLCRYTVSPLFSWVISRCHRPSLLCDSRRREAADEGGEAHQPRYDERVSGAVRSQGSAEETCREEMMSVSILPCMCVCVCMSVVLDIIYNKKVFIQTCLSCVRLICTFRRPELLSFLHFYRLSPLRLVLECKVELHIIIKLN